MGVDRGRISKTWRLCESLLDYLPQARQPSSTLGTLPGLAPSRHVPCDSCGARGRLSLVGKPCASCAPRLGPKGHVMPLKPGHGCHMCPTCEGTGWRRRRKADPEFDAYAGIQVPETKAPDDYSLTVGEVRQALAEQRERPEIAHAALARAQRDIDLVERPEAERFAWEEAWERMCATGSYRELVVALEILRMKEVERYRIVWHIVCNHEPVRLSEGRQAFLNESMSALTALMPERIRVPRYLREDVVARGRKKSLWHGRSPAHGRERRERDAEIRRRREEDGTPIGTLQREYALSRMQVHRILASGRGREERSQEHAA